ncbi:conserved hypothetical protein (fragment) [Bartonella tribocorum CIP 105476]|uniref:Uncharacterized protein n=1 Tax=Bartonella tribocorum (strain DSM 28219 / CCUG 45778 / CIP 105476 / IBS 506) TaxID=382640 RepID=A9IL73_BART1
MMNNNKEVLMDAPTMKIKQNTDSFIKMAQLAKDIH